MGISDYNCIIDWFTRAHGKNNSATEQDAKTYQKIVVMATAYANIIEFLAKHGKDV